jgi:hypothetical protein
VVAMVDKGLKRYDAFVTNIPWMVYSLGYSRMFHHFHVVGHDSQKSPK